MIIQVLRETKYVSYKAIGKQDYSCGQLLQFHFFLSLWGGGGLFNDTVISIGAGIA
jgi:hypothetical protein